jgi:hypothetical protein
MIANLVAGYLGAGGGVATDYESIATANGTGSSGVITFSSIPSTYSHLQIRGMTVTSLNFQNTLVTFNGDTGANYSQHQLVGTGSAASANGLTNQNNMTLGQNGTSTYPSADIMDILDYADTNKYKTVRDLSGVDSNNTGQGLIILRSGSWRNTAAITSITLTLSGGNYNSATSYALYGIK